MTLRSRMPESAMFSVRGIGVAVSVSKSTVARSWRMRSLWRTPKRCSSSTMSRPSRWNATSFWRSRCVPITTSSRLVRSCSIVRLFSTGDWNRDSTPTLTG